MGFCSPSLLGDQEGQGLQLCLGIPADPGSTKKQAGIKVGLHLPSFSVCFFCLSDLAPRIYRGHLHCPPLPCLDSPPRGGTGQTCSSQWDHITGNFWVFTHRWTWKAWLALKSLGEEVRRSPLLLATRVERGTGGAACKLCPHLPKMASRGGSG